MLRITPSFERKVVYVERKGLGGKKYKVPIYYYEHWLKSPKFREALKRAGIQLSGGIWDNDKLVPAVPYTSPGQVPVERTKSVLWKLPMGSFLPKAMQRLRSRYSAYLGEVNKPKQTLEYISQGSILQNPEPHLLGVLPGRRKKSLIKSRSIVLKRRWFAKRFKGLTHQVVAHLSTKEIPEGWKMRSEPKYVKDIEVIAFADAPVGSFLNKGGYDGRGRDENGFLRIRTF